MFYFVDSNSSSKEKRAHVMRHHVQEKRKQRKFSHGMIQEQLNDSLSWSARKDSGYDTDCGKDVALIGTPGPSTQQDTPVWKTINNHHDPHQNIATTRWC
jgi:hypothetical protein